MATSAPPSPANRPDPFLAGDDQRPLTFAELDARQASEVVLIVPAASSSGRFSLTPEVLSLLRTEVQAWLRVLRERGLVVTELISASVRDQSVRSIIDRLLEVAYKAPSRAWMTSLPTGRQVLIAPTELVDSLGVDSLSRVAHENAIRNAQARGLPFNAQAWAHYQSMSPNETM